MASNEYVENFYLRGFLPCEACNPDAEPARMNTGCGTCLGWGRVWECEECGHTMPLLLDEEEQLIGHWCERCHPGDYGTADNAQPTQQPATDAVTTEAGDG